MVVKCGLEVAAIVALRLLLDDEQVVEFGDLHARVHVTGYPGIVDRNDCLGLSRDGGL